VSRAFWERKTATGPSSWASYWDTIDAPHRNVIIDALRSLPAFGSLLEIGCGPGVNLFRVLQAFPDVDVTGLDISPGAIDFGTAVCVKPRKAASCRAPAARRSALASSRKPSR
jgi:SAM-dependent methyltransferase